MTEHPDEAGLRDAAAAAVETAQQLGADAVSATVNAGSGLRVSVMDGAVDTAVRDAQRSLTLTVYRDGRNGTAVTAALDRGSIARVAEEALAIAAAVQPDADGGLADADLLAFTGEQPPTYAGEPLDAGRLLEEAFELEALTLDQPVREGAAIRLNEVSAFVNESAMALATSAGFCRSAGFSVYGRWATVMASEAGKAVRDSGQSIDRRRDALDDAPIIAGRAVRRALGALGGRPVPSQRVPVLLDARIASALIQDLVAGLSGDAQYRRATVLYDSIGSRVAAAHLDLLEDPFEPFGMASGGFDKEGVSGSARSVIAGGVVEGYFLGTVSARRLGMRSTGNAGGAWNLRLASCEGAQDLPALLRTLGTGLYVTQLMGGATNPVTGNWTRAVGGFWVENGDIGFPVADVTVGGSLKEMLSGVVALGSDVERSGAIRTGSILIDAMQIGGSA